MQSGLGCCTPRAEGVFQTFRVRRTSLSCFALHANRLLDRGFGNRTFASRMPLHAHVSFLRFRACTLLLFIGGLVNAHTLVTTTYRDPYNRVICEVAPNKTTTRFDHNPFGSPKETSIAPLEVSDPCPSDQIMRLKI